MGIKVAVIGGGSTYTPELIEGLANRRDRLPIDELVLEDLDPDRLSVVGGLAERMLRRLEWTGRLSLISDPVEAIEGASFVLVQLRVGGQVARLSDETLPLQFGTIGQETTGAGGLAKALRTVPVVLELADLADRHAAPGAWLIDFTNPVGIVTQALIDTGHHAIGLCNVAISLQRSIARRIGVDPDSLELGQTGLNHLSWITAIRADGRDLLPEILDTHGESIARELGLPVSHVRDLGAVPSYYLRYYDAFDDVMAEQLGGHHRAEEVMDLEDRLLAMYADPALDTKPELLNDRGGAWYSEAAARLLASLHDGRGDVQVVDVRNGDAMPDLAADDVVEVPARIDRDGAHPIRQAPMPPAMRDLVRSIKAFERLAIRAAMSGERGDVRAALEAHPLVGGRIGDVEPLLDALLAANRQHLPRFGATR
ncbi:MAG TPA: 6-phospho-beta-glucosidase [Candidatus Limnocylindria bacterium]|nr:6-phospho-beta-glucosidase [Candidatus Limnocylindria bacterium]